MQYHPKFGNLYYYIDPDDVNNGDHDSSGATMLVPLSRNDAHSIIGKDRKSIYCFLSIVDAW